MSRPESGARAEGEGETVGALLKAMDLLLVCLAAAVMGISL